MSDWHPVVVKIGKINKLKNSDFLSITNVMDIYPVIIKTNDFKEGDLASFLPYDTIVPDNDSFYFLCPVDGDKNKKYDVGSVPEKYRTISARKLRGTYSEGLLVQAPPGYKEGDSVVDHFKLSKRVYEEELDEVNNYKVEFSDFANVSYTNENEKKPKTFELKKYDLEGFAKYSKCFKEGEHVLIQEKLEGQNLCMIYAENKLFVKSRNYFKRKRPSSVAFSGILKTKNKLLFLIKWLKALYVSILIAIKNPPLREDSWWKIAEKYSLEKKMKRYNGIAIFGEWYGNLSKFKYDCKGNERDFRVFDMYDVYNKRYLEWEEVKEISSQLGLKVAPVLYEGPFENVEKLKELAEGKSEIGNHVKEGFVMRAIPESNCDGLGRKIIKLKGKDYKLFKG